jgi:AcrR family transcriptional regulator
VNSVQYNLAFQLIDTGMPAIGHAERRSRQKQAMRERILDAARRIVMREGFAALSMRKIADAVEYSPASLYLHFASRDEIARALCTEGYAQLLETFAPVADIADPAERLKALGRAYVAFGIANPQTYRLIFMQDPSYTAAVLVSAAEANDRSSVDDTDDAAFRMMVDALAALQADGRLPASANLGVWAEALWATMHGIVALRLSWPMFARASLDRVVDTALDAWLGGQRDHDVHDVGERDASPDAADAKAHMRADAGPTTATKPPRA